MVTLLRQVVPAPNGKGQAGAGHAEPIVERPPSQHFGREVDLDQEVEEIGSGGIIGPLPPGHSRQWHRDHPYPHPNPGQGGESLSTRWLSRDEISTSISKR